MGESQSVDYSEEFYKHHAQRYSEVSHQLLQSVYVSSSHPALKTDMDLLEPLTGLVSGRRGLDAGCGAGARDVHHLWGKGYDVYGIDAVEENIQVAKALHPEIADRVSVVDLRDPLEFPDDSFDFVICNAVIQHIEPDNLATLLSEFARVLRPEGVLQLMFKNGKGVITVFDRDYGAERSFHLYEEGELLDRLKALNLLLVEPGEPESLGGIMYFTDPKPVDHCVFYVRKSE
jgi:SAM-dependent methyltransferase